MAAVRARVGDKVAANVSAPASAPASGATGCGGVRRSVVPPEDSAASTNATRCRASRATEAMRSMTSPTVSPLPVSRLVARIWGESVPAASASLNSVSGFSHVKRSALSSVATAKPA